MAEQINHPVHYTKQGHKECIEEMIDIFGIEYVAIWCKITAYKYKYRMGLKEGNPVEQDKAKMQWYTDKFYELADKALETKRTGD